MQENIKKLLHEDEEILWQAQPNKNLFTGADLLMIPATAFTFTIFLLIRFLAIPMFMEMKPPLGFDVMFALIIFLAFYQLVIRFFVKAYVYKRTEYCVTNKRVLEIRNFNKIKVEAVNISEIKSYHKVMKQNGKSKVVFGELPPFSFYMENTYAYPRFAYSSYNKPPLAFYDLDAEDAEAVYNMIGKVKNSL